MTEPRRVLHVAQLPQWQAAEQAGVYLISTRGRTLAEEGFIHLSTPAQVGGVLDRYYADLDPAGLRLLVVDVPGLVEAGSVVRWETVPGAEDPFPHCYGPIPTEAIVGVLPIGGTTGSPVLPDLTGWV